MLQDKFLRQYFWDYLVTITAKWAPDPRARLWSFLVWVEGKVVTS